MENNYVPYMYEDQWGNLYNDSFIEQYESDDPDYYHVMAYPPNLVIVAKWRIKELKQQ